MPPLRWGFIGAGFVASRALAPAVHASPGAHLQAVASRDLAKAHALTPTTTYSDYNALLADPTVDAVYISLPNHLHAAWVIAALNAGKHVLCEKPFATSAHETQTMIAAATECQRTLMEAIWFKWHPRMRRLTELVERGAIGPITTIDSGFSFVLDAPENYRLDPAMGGGSLLDLGPYQLHLWAALTGNTAQIDYDTIERELSARGVDLTTSFTARINQGISATSVVSFTRAPEQHIRVSGIDTTIDFTTGEAFTSWHAPSSLTLAGVEEAFPPVDPFQLMIEDFASITEGAPNTTAPLETTLFVAQQLERIAARA
jgi:D-xylose 1-dehydrogenase (NADP+, D-xylono-1,5-lactone-forming)